MRLTQLFCRQYTFRYWKRYIDRCLYEQNAAEVWRPIVGWKIHRKRPEFFFYDEHRPWTEGFKNDNMPGTKKKTEIFVEPIKDWVIFKGDRVCCIDRYLMTFLLLIF